MAVTVIHRLAMSVMMMRAAIMRMAMFRMYLIACHLLIEGHDKALSAAAACMHAETDDTHHVPSDQQNCKNLCNQAFHSNLQNYKFASELQGISQ
jgi:hypothetical protein